jgi:hypothetical protein
LIAVMLEVDEQRFEPRVQAAYDVCDDVTWFIRVTDQLYLQAVKRALPGEPPSVEYDAMQQVYQVRADALERSDDAMLELLSSLTHVKHDRAYACPLAVGDILPALRVYALDGSATSIDELVHAAPTSATVLLTGSWS